MSRECRAVWWFGRRGRLPQLAVRELSDDGKPPRALGFEPTYSGLAADVPDGAFRGSGRAADQGRALPGS